MQELIIQIITNNAQIVYCRSVFELKLFDNQKAASNVVKLALAQPEASTKYFLLQKQVEVKVAATVSLADVQLGAADRDQTAPALKK